MGSNKIYIFIGIKNFNILEKFNKPIGEGAVICLAEDDLPITREVNRIPIGYLL